MFFKILFICFTDDGEDNKIFKKTKPDDVKSVSLFFFRLPKKTQSQWDVREERKKKKKVHGPSRATFGNIRIGKLVFLLRSSIFSPLIFFFFFDTPVGADQSPS